jgi:hypothetical protein
MEVLDDNYRSNPNNRTIEDLMENGYETDAYRYIREGWELFKKNAGLFVAFTLVVLLINIGLSEVKLGFIANLFISPCLIAGWYLVARKVSYNETVEFKDFFDGFQHWQKVVPFYLVAEIFMIIGLVCLILPGIYLAVSYLFVIPIILFYQSDLSLMEVLEGSRNVITKKWWNFLGFIGLLILVNVAGALCLGVGLLASIPTSVCATYMAYEDLFGAGVGQETDTPL